MPVAWGLRGGQVCGGLVAGHPPAPRAATGLGEAARSAIERGVAADARQAVLPAVSDRPCPIGPVAASPAWTCPGMSWNADWGAVGAAVSRRRRKWPEHVAPGRAWSVQSPFESCHGRLMSVGREHAAARSRERIGGMVGKRRSVIRVSPSPGREGAGRRRSVRHPPRALAREPPGQDGARRRPSRRAPPRGAPARCVPRTVPMARTAQSKRIPSRCVWRRRTGRPYGSHPGDIGETRRSAALARMRAT